MILRTTKATVETLSRAPKPRALATINGTKTANRPVPARVAKPTP